MLAQEGNCAHVRDHRCCGRVRESGLQRPFVHRAAGCGYLAARLLRLHLEHHHDADRGVPDLHLRWLVHQAEDHRGRDHGLFAIPLACSMAHHDQVHRAHPDRDRVHLIPRAIPRLHDHLAQGQSRYHHHERGALRPLFVSAYSLSNKLSVVLEINFDSYIYFYIYSQNTKQT